MTGTYGMISADQKILTLSIMLMFLSCLTEQYKTSKLNISTSNFVISWRANPAENTGNVTTYGDTILS